MYKRQIISGKAFPNSFITLYIFSVPIVVTVKTSDDGSWSYRFDKELEDGNHEVYIGVTDNAGRIVAKSEPFKFIKTAEAYTETSPTSELATPEEIDINRFDSKYMILIVLSVSVVSIGLLLILLGLYMKTSKSIVENTKRSENYENELDSTS